MIRFNCIILFIALVLSASAEGISSYDSSDSVKVVKGQVSDYYIPVTHSYEVTGRVSDGNGTPLEGATVMFFASPCHCNTDAAGNYHLTATDGDLHLYVYYPGKAFANVFRHSDQHKVNIVLNNDSLSSSFQLRCKAVVTPWFDPYHDTTSTYCNPLNISYNYEPFNDNVKANGSFRSAADPMGLTYKDSYLLFSTNQGGFHYSRNLSDWDFCTASFQRFPTDDDQCAPAAYVVGDTLFYTGSTYLGLPVWYTLNPWSGCWRQAVARNSLPSWDPCLFLDDDGRLYLYYGSSNEYPIKAVQVSRDNFLPVSKIHDAVMLNPERHGWERFGMNNDDETTLRPFIEGAYMTKHDNRYYLQYGGPGTEFKVYADGVYVGDNPLGPFTYQRHNPMCYKPGGFVEGAGHGGTFVDFHGNYWHVATCMLSLKYKFERRIGLYPLAFDGDGVMYSSTAFGDYPCWNADRNLKNPADRFTGWMLLSYGKRATVSSVDSIYAASNLTDENMRTFWTARSGKAGEWAQVDLGAVKNIRAIQLNFYDYKTVQHNRANDIYYQYQIFASSDGSDWKMVVDKSDNDKDAPHDYLQLKSVLQARYIKVVNLRVPSDGYFCLSELRVFGNADGAKPSPVKGFNVARSSKDSRDAVISWKPSAGAYGYNIYYGTAADKMYNCITVLGKTDYDFRGMDVGSDYYFSIEALGETGRSALSKTIKK
jgi:xylan 1,4-beta-xylosidase